mmetsp:Transcript_13887/g.26154  ORF Transcript_13887/g.26154 Transcript_13887/m.26154 type:complete len:292 (-) Transcript_13887:2306-3181(-)
MRVEKAILFPILLAPSIATAFAPQPTRNKVVTTTTTTTRAKSTGSSTKRTPLASSFESNFYNFHHCHDTFNQHPLEEEDCAPTSSRRQILEKTAFLLPMAILGASSALPSVSYAASGAADYSTDYSPEFVQQYSDFVKTEEGWQYKDIKVGTGDVVLQPGDRAVFEWSGYTIGYYGRPFEAKGGPAGGAFDKDLDYSRVVIGSGTVIPGVEKALMTMKPGGVRQLVLPYGPLSYPPDDLKHVRVGPKPSTFSGQRALNFVLENPRLDRTLLFNIKLVRIDKSDGKGGYIRG